MPSTPEGRARKRIDAMLAEVGWVVQDATAFDFGAGRGVALREFSLARGAADYVLLVDRHRNQFSRHQRSARPLAPRLSLPPLAEQKQIVAEVERLLPVADDAAATIDRELQRAERLRQSIVKQAFSGRLVDATPGATEAAPTTAEPTGQVTMNL